MVIKIFECEICKGFFQNKIKGEKRFRGNRRDVRKHLVEDHKIKGMKNIFGMKTKDFGQSPITKEMISEPFN